MNFIEAIELALKNIKSSKMRTFLTMLGIIIGVSAVIVIVGLGNGMETYMADSFQSMGTNTLTVSIFGKGNSSRRITEPEMYAYVKDNPEYFNLISPTVSVTKKVKFQTAEAEKTSVTGVNEDFFDIKQYTLSSGRGICYLDSENRHNVCVVGSYFEKEYLDGSGLGKTIKIGGIPFEVIGTLSPNDEEGEEGSSDDAVYIPYTTASRLMGTNNINSYTVTVASEDTASASKIKLESKLLEVYGTFDAYFILSMTEMLDMMKSMIGIMVTVLAIIAGISLVVGGIGIMNIMLVSVTERTREIGIRKALGAKERYIMSQFIIEAAMTSSLGGILGIIFGSIFSSIATFAIGILTKESMVVSATWQSILFAFSISAGIGILFGYLPAKKASQLNPIDALRYE